MASVNSAPSSHRTIQVAGSSPASLPNNLNFLFFSFFSRFETNTLWLEAIISLIPKACSNWTLLQHRGGGQSPEKDHGEQSSDGVYLSSGFNNLWRVAQFPSYGRIPHGPHPQEEAQSKLYEACGSHLSCDEGYGEGQKQPQKQKQVSFLLSLFDQGAPPCSAWLWWRGEKWLYVLWVWPRTHSLSTWSGHGMSFIKLLEWVMNCHLKSRREEHSWKKLGKSNDTPCPDKGGGIHSNKGSQQFTRKVYSMMEDSP